MGSDMNRRQFLAASSTAGLAALAGVVPPVGRALFAAGDAQKRLRMPPLLDTQETGLLALTARTGQTNFLGMAPTRTSGFSQSYLGPTIRMRNGPLPTRIANQLYDIVTVHWHGLLVPGEYDGGPQSPVLPGRTWRGEMPIDQRPTTLWYHSHVCGRTAPDVYAGLAGALHITDGRDDDRGLPSIYGHDDLTLIYQDRRFNEAGRMVYDVSRLDIENGFHGNRMLINGQASAVAVVPRGIVRLRLINASNARIYSIHLSDERPLFLIGTDGGFLPKPVELKFVRMAPGERCEVLVDFADGPAPILMNKRGVSIGVLAFAVDDSSPARIVRIPESLDAEPFDLPEEGVPTRRLGLNLGGAAIAPESAQPLYGTVLCRAGSAGPLVNDFGINGHAYNVDRIEFEVKHGAVERWVIGGGGVVEHPFHIHGIHFRVLSETGGAPPRPENRGWKDTVLITGETEIVARFSVPASRDTPYMYHCHILEHEDAGMMGQFAVV